MSSPTPKTTSTKQQDLVTSVTRSSCLLGFLLPVLLLYANWAGVSISIQAVGCSKMHSEELSPYYRNWSSHALIMGVAFVVFLLKLLHSISAPTGTLEVSSLLGFVQYHFFLGGLGGLCTSSWLTQFMMGKEAWDLATASALLMLPFLCWKRPTLLQEQPEDSRRAMCIANSTVVLGFLMGILMIYTTQGASFVALMKDQCHHETKVPGNLLLWFLFGKGCLLMSIALMRHLVSSLVNQSGMLPTVQHSLFVGAVFGYVCCWILTCIAIGKPVGLLHLLWISVASLLFWNLPCPEEEEEEKDTTSSATKEPLLMATLV